MEIKANRFYKLWNLEDYIDCWDYEHCLDEVEYNYKNIKNRIKAIYKSGYIYVIEMEDGTQHIHNEYAGITLWNSNREIESKTYGDGNDLSDERDLAYILTGIVREIYYIYEAIAMNKSINVGLRGNDLIYVKPYKKYLYEELAQFTKITW